MTPLCIYTMRSTLIYFVLIGLIGHLMVRGVEGSTVRPPTPPAELPLASESKVDPLTPVTTDTTAVTSAPSSGGNTPRAPSPITPRKRRSLIVEESPSRADTPRPTTAATDTDAVPAERPVTPIMSFRSRKASASSVESTSPKSSPDAKKALHTKVSRRPSASGGASLHQAWEQFTVSSPSTTLIRSPLQKTRKVDEKTEKQPKVRDEGASSFASQPVHPKLETVLGQLRRKP